jgi:hypothetical protein
MKTVDYYVNEAEREAKTAKSMSPANAGGRAAIANVYAQLALVAMAQKIYEADHGKS